MQDRWERHAGLTGVAAVVLWVIGIFILEGIGDKPDTDASGASALAYFKGEENSILIGTFLFMLGALLFLWFVGTLRTRLYWAEGGTGRVAATAFGGGIATGTLLLVMGATQAAGAINRDNLSPEAAQVYLGIGDAFFYAAELAASVLVLGTALVILRTGVLPRWLAWVSLVVTLGLLIPPIGWAALIFAVPLWMIAISLMLYLRPIPPPGPPPHTAQFVGTE